MYKVENHMTYRVDNGERILLAAFEARIIEETKLIDGANTETFLTITGKIPSEDEEGEDLPTIEIPSIQFPQMTWVMSNWGVRALIYPESNVKEHLRTAIQTHSIPKRSEIFKSMGWQNIRGKEVYLHAGGAITEKGNDPNIQVKLPQELQKYDLDSGTSEVDLKTAWDTSISLITIATPEQGWPLWAAMWAPLLDDVDFAIHLTGRSGTFKSELVSLFLSHYGKELDARHLPGSWSSTANALEAQSHYARNAPFVIDDFVPNGSSWQVRNYQTNADKIIRAQGNQAGRARLSDTASFQSAYYPRGIIVSTGEDIPEGHSVRARMLIIEMTPGDVDTKKLTAAQAKRDQLPNLTQAFIQFLCANDCPMKDRIDEYRDQMLNIGHSRTPPMLARLIVVVECVLEWAETEKFITRKQSEALAKQARGSLQAVGNQQINYLENADPVELIKQAMRTLLSNAKAHVRTLQGGVPRNPTVLGWTEEHSTSGGMMTYKAHGPCIGWIAWDDDVVYLEANSGWAAVKKEAGAELALTKQTAVKRLKDAGLITRSDDARQRNTVRITAENHPRQVVALSLCETLDIEENPNVEPGGNDPLAIE